MASAVSLSAECAAVVARWNPIGMAELERARAASPDARAVAVVDPVRGEPDRVADELALLSTDLEFSTASTDAPVVLVVLDASAPLGASALRTLDRLGAGGSRIVFALDGIDAHRDWRTVRERNAEMVAEHVGPAADTTIWPVSNRLARMARAAGTRMDVRTIESGMVELHGALADAVSRAPTHADRLADAVDALVERTRTVIAAKADAIRNSDDTAELRTQRAALVTRRDGGRPESIAALRSQVQLARVELIHDVGSRVRGANASARADIDGCDRDALVEYPQRLAATVETMAVDVDDRVRTRLAEVQTAAIAQATPIAYLDNRIDGVEPPEPRIRGVEDKMTIAVGASAGVGLGRLAVAPLTMVPALDIATIPVTLVLGGCAAWWLTRSRGHASDRAHVRQWASDTLVNVKAQLEQRVLAAVVEVEAQLGEELTRAGTARGAEVDRQIAGIDTEIRRRTARRAAQLASCDRDLDVIGRNLADRGTERRSAASNTSS